MLGTSNSKIIWHRNVVTHCGPDKKSQGHSASYGEGYAFLYSFFFFVRDRMRNYEIRRRSKVTGIKPRGLACCGWCAGRPLVEWNNDDDDLWYFKGYDLNLINSTPLKPDTVISLYLQLNAS